MGQDTFFFSLFLQRHCIFSAVFVSSHIFLCALIIIKADGKEKNVRTLLATLQDVLWEGARYRPVNLGDLMDPKKLQRAYKKACLVIRPDYTSKSEHADLV